MSGTIDAGAAETALAGRLDPGAITAWGERLVAAAGDAGMTVWAIGERARFASPTAVERAEAVQVTRAGMLDAAVYTTGALFGAGFELRWAPAPSTLPAAGAQPDPNTRKLDARYVGAPPAREPHGVAFAPEALPDGVDPVEERALLWGAATDDRLDAMGRQRFVVALIPRDLWYPVAVGTKTVWARRRVWRDPDTGQPWLWRFAGLVEEERLV